MQRFLTRRKKWTASLFQSSPRNVKHPHALFCAMGQISSIVYEILEEKFSTR